MSEHRIWRAAQSLLPIACLAILAGGCTASVSSNPPPPVVIEPGTLTLDWTINGTKDPNECVMGQAATLHLTIFDDRGVRVGDYAQACAAFATSVTLDPGHYSADAKLEDSASTPRTTTINVVPFTIYSSTDLNVPVDFPASAFFQPF